MSLTLPSFENATSHCYLSHSPVTSPRKNSGDGENDAFARVNERVFPGMRLEALDGVRVLSAIIVIFHHIPSLDSEIAGSGGSGRVLKYVGDFQDNFWGYVLLVGIGPGKIAVETFLIMAGLVAAYPCWIDGSLQRYEKGLIKRFFRLALPVIPVQMVHFILYKYHLAYGNYNRFPTESSVEESYSQGLASVFARQLNGALWILPAFLFSPFVALCVQYPAFRLRTRCRFLWYIACLAYLGGNFFDESTISPYFPVVVGVLLSDVYANLSSVIGSSILISRSSILMCAILLFTPWLPGDMYAHKLSLIICAASFVYLAQFWKPLHCLMNNRFMKVSSKYTFQLYIWHLVVLNTFGATITPLANGTMEKMLAYVGAYFCTFLVAFFAFWLIEKPTSFVNKYFERFMFTEETTVFTPPSHKYHQLRVFEEPEEEPQIQGDIKAEGAGTNVNSLRNRVSSPNAKAKAEKPTSGIISFGMRNLFNDTSTRRSPRQQLLQKEDPSSIETV